MAVILSDITSVRNSNLKFITSGELYMINYFAVKLDVFFCGETRQKLQFYSLHEMGRLQDVTGFYFFGKIALIFFF